MSSTKKILLAVSGGIAAYKAAELCRLLIKQGHQVRVLMTQNAMEFIRPLTFEALTGEKVFYRNFDAEADGSMAHIELAKWPDILLIAPATANVLAKLSHGIADDLLSSVCLAADAKIIVAPAMNKFMWSNLATQTNIETLRQRNVTILGPASGSQACGDVGEGRLLEPELIAEYFSFAQPFYGKRVVITAGPTVEAIDPVRYLTNRSTGKMGYALAQAAQNMGAKVVLVSGPTQLSCPVGVERIDVESAAQMHDAVIHALSEQTDYFICAAAVADFTVDYASHKLKKHDGESVRQLKLVQTQDILKAVSQQRLANCIVGFAAETEHLLDYAKEKLDKKGCDIIVANQVGVNQGFGADEHAVTIITASGQTIPLSTCHKRQLAYRILQSILTL